MYCTLRIVHTGAKVSYVLRVFRYVVPPPFSSFATTKNKRNSVAGSFNIQKQHTARTQQYNTAKHYFVSLLLAALIQRQRHGISKVFDCTLHITSYFAYASIPVFFLFLTAAKSSAVARPNFAAPLFSFALTTSNERRPRKQWGIPFKSHVRVRSISQAEGFGFQQ